MNKLCKLTMALATVLFLSAPAFAQDAFDSTADTGSQVQNTGNYTGPEPWTCMEANVLHEMHDENAPRSKTARSRR